MADLIIRNVDPELLRKQYRELARLQERSTGLVTVMVYVASDDLEGLINFLEGIFDQNPEHFPIGGIDDKETD